ncbi:MAG: pseudaminic acid synthase [Nitrospirales bacterium]
MQNQMKIGDRLIGEGQPCYIVAEISANHNQSFENAEKIIHAAKKAGADAVKLQTYTPDTMTLDCEREEFQIPSDSIWSGKKLFELYAEAYTPWDWHPKLQRIAHDCGLDFFSTPFDETAVDFLDKLKIPVFKVASFEIVDLPLLKKIAGTGKPVIVSTGMSSLAEIEEAVATLRKAGTKEIALLKCTSAYPASPSGMNLLTIPYLSKSYNVPIGLSDHTLGGHVAIAAVTLGANIVEKHFIFSRSDGGPDSSFSMEPEEFSHMVTAIRDVEQALGGISFEPNSEEQKSLCFRRSLFVVQDVHPGEQMTLKNVRTIRPGYGLAPKFLEQVLGKRAKKPIQKGTPLSWGLVDGEGSA